MFFSDVFFLFRLRPWFLLVSFQETADSGINQISPSFSSFSLSPSASSEAWYESDGTRRQARMTKNTKSTEYSNSKISVKLTFAVLLDP